MLQFFSKYKFFAVFLLVLSAIIISIFYQILKPTPKLKVYSPSDVNPELVDTTLQHIKKQHYIAPFKLIDQNGDTVTQETYSNKIYVADFFFTTCLTICPKMTGNMKYLQEQLMTEKDVLLLSHTVTPEIDSVAQLKKYAIEKGVDDSKWHLVTGDKKEIYTLARKSYLAVKDYPEIEDYGMIHTENFILVDQKKQIRGMYDGTNLEEIEQLLEDIKILQQEK